jgi:hypothetical protein
VAHGGAGTAGGDAGDRVSQRRIAGRVRNVAAFRQGLQEAGYVEGMNVAIEYRFAENQYDRLPAMAAELVHRQVAVIVANTLGALAPQLKDMQAAARILGVQLHVLHASTERDFDTVFATLAQLRAGALVVGTDGFFLSRSEQLAALTAAWIVPPS